MGRIKPRDPCCRKQVFEKIGALVGQLVEMKPRTGLLSQDCQQACPGRWLQHEVAGANIGGVRCDKCQWQRRGKLLEGICGFVAARVGGQKGDHLDKHCQEPCGRPELWVMLAPNLRTNITCAASRAS